MAEFETAIDAFEADQKLAAVVLAGEGAVFSAGGDIEDFERIPDRAEGRRMSLWMQDILNRWASLPCPTLAALGGHVYGGGWELAAACDIRILDTTASIVFRQTAMGLPPGWGGGQRLARLVGPSRAILWLASATTLEAHQAQAAGFVDMLAPAGAALEYAQNLATAIARNSSLAVRNTKRALIEGANKPLHEAIALEAELFAECWGSEGHRRAVAAFFARRRPVAPH